MMVVGDCHMCLVVVELVVLEVRGHAAVGRCSWIQIDYCANPFSAPSGF
jgi:hypothetical protein